MVGVRVVSYNIRSLRDDRAAVVRTLRDLDADVVCVQEAPRLLRWRSKCAALAREAGLLYVAGGGTTGGTALLAADRVDVPAHREYRLSRTPRAFRRGAVAARVHAGGAWCVVASVHLGLDADERVRHQAEVRSLVDRFDEAVTILAGDFNERPDGAARRALAVDFTDSGTLAGAPTYPASNPRHRIDAIMVRGPARVSPAQVVDNEVTRRASDHLPVVVDLELPG